MEMNVKQGDNGHTQNRLFPTHTHRDNFNPFSFTSFSNNPFHLEPRVQCVGRGFRMELNAMLDLRRSSYF